MNKKERQAEKERITYYSGEIIKERKIISKFKKDIILMMQDPQEYKFELEVANKWLKEHVDRIPRMQDEIKWAKDKLKRGY